MSDKKPKLTKEQMKQLEQLQKMLAQGMPPGGPGGMPQGMPQGMPGGMPPGMPGMPKRPPLYTPRGLFMAIIMGMQSSVKFLDQFTNFIINRKTKNTNDVIDTARSPILFGFWVVFIFVFLGSIWAATAPLDSASVAIGTVVSDTKKRTINHPEGGIIKEIYVKPGDEVKIDDKLIEFDGTRVLSDYEAYLSQYRASLAAEARLQAEINELDKVEYPEFLTKDIADPEVSKLIETQDNLFHSKIEAFKSEADTLRQRIKQAEKQIDGYEARKVSSQKSLEVIQDRLEATKKLLEKGYSNKAALLDLEEKEARAFSDIAVSDTEIARTEQQITESEISLINQKSRALANTLSELKDVQVRLPEFAEKYRDTKARVERLILKAPVEGVINKVEYTTVGSSVQAFAPLIEVSPKNDKLIIEANIPPKGIQSIHAGMTAKIRFSAFKSRVSPIFLGEVKSVSPDIVMPNRQMPDPSLMNGYYTAEIEIDFDDFKEKAEPRHLELKPGMQAEVQIITGERTLLRYLLDPVRDAMFKGFKEK